MYILYIFFTSFLIYGLLPWTMAKYWYSVDECKTEKPRHGTQSTWVDNPLICFPRWLSIFDMWFATEPMSGDRLETTKQSWFVVDFIPMSLPPPWWDDIEKTHRYVGTFWEAWSINQKTNTCIHVYSLMCIMCIHFNTMRKHDTSSRSVLWTEA